MPMVIKLMQAAAQSFMYMYNIWVLCSQRTLNNIVIEYFLLHWKVLICSIKWMSQCFDQNLFHLFILGWVGCRGGEGVCRGSELAVSPYITFYCQRLVFLLVPSTLEISLPASLFLASSQTFFCLVTQSLLLNPTLGRKDRVKRQKKVWGGYSFLTSCRLPPHLLPGIKLEYFFSIIKAWTVCFGFAFVQLSNWLKYSYKVL